MQDLESKGSTVHVPEVSTHVAESDPQPFTSYMAVAQGGVGERTLWRSWTTSAKASRCSERFVSRTEYDTCWKKR